MDVTTNERVGGDMPPTLCSQCGTALLDGERRCHIAGYRMGPEALADVVGASGIPLEYACATAIRYVGVDAVRRMTGLTAASHGYLIPYPRFDGARCYPPTWRSDDGYWRIRMHWSRKPRYVAPRGLPPRVYVPPFEPFTSGEWPEELFVTEGEKKAIAATVKGIPALGLAGVWAWKSRGPDDLATMLPDLKLVPWRGRRVWLVYDSDITPNHRARPAFLRLGRVLRHLGADSVHVSNVGAPRAA
jgi:Domain of unknown function (DUF3854)